VNVFAGEQMPQLQTPSNNFIIIIVIISSSSSRTEQNYS